MIKAGQLLTLSYKEYFISEKSEHLFTESLFRGGGPEHLL